MKHHNHTQYAREINRRIFTSGLNRRAEAVVDFLITVACLFTFGFIGLLLAWRG
jgi:hypothetical protein